MHGVIVSLLAFAILVAACSPVDSDQGESPNSSTVTSTSSPTASTTVPTTPHVSSMAEGGCPPGDVMLADGRLLTFDRPTADSNRITGITWRMTAECQVITVSFATADGAPATSPPTLTARLLSNAGVLRIETEATQSSIVDQLVEEGFVERLYVPVDEGETRFIDLVLSRAAVARARVLTSPAQLEIELQPGEPESVGHPLITDSVVIVEPGSAAVAQPLLDITGYSIGATESVEVTVEKGTSVIESSVLELEPAPNVWTAFHHMVSVGGDSYDMLRLTSEEGGVIAAIPFSR